MFDPSTHYEFKSWGENATSREYVEYHFFNTLGAAKAKAGRMSKKINGPVDVARASGGAWNARYITTATPSEHHASGYSFKRLV